MIFLSYSHKDKAIIAPMAEVLRKVFGEDALFFDQWSIQPGDSLIDRMEAGLDCCRFFFFLVSKNSLSSQMVGLEWKNALMKHIKGEVTFIPVKVDHCDMPTILLQNLYINLYGNGMEFALRQMIDVASGKNTYRPEEVTGFQNVRAFISGTDREITVEFRAEAYTEPQSKYLIFIDNNQEEVNWKAPQEAVFVHEFIKDLLLDTGKKVNAIRISRSEATSPGFPFVVNLSVSGNIPLVLRGIMRAKAADSFTPIPVIDNRAVKN